MSLIDRIVDIENEMKEIKKQIKELKNNENTGFKYSKKINKSNEIQKLKDFVGLD